MQGTSIFPIQINVLEELQEGVYIPLWTAILLVHCIRNLHKVFDTVYSDL